MKKNYIAPSLDIEKIEMMQNLMLSISSISTGEPFAEGEEGIADAPVRLDAEDTDFDF